MMQSKLIDYFISEPATLLKLSQINFCKEIRASILKKHSASFQLTASD